MSFEPGAGDAQRISVIPLYAGQSDSRRYTHTGIVDVHVIWIPHRELKLPHVPERRRVV